MQLFICKYCGKECKNKRSVSSHQTLCISNPNSNITTMNENRNKALAKVACRWCNGKYSKTNIKKHEQKCIKNPTHCDNIKKDCPVCNTVFIGSGKTCSRSCTNKFFNHARKGGSKYKTDKELAEANRYRDLCFKHHEKKCVCCDEVLIVAVHHLNENKLDNRPENLIPMCPTHHQYWHSSYRYLVENTVMCYIKDWSEKKLLENKEK